MNISIRALKHTFFILLTYIFFSSPLIAADWSTTELQWQYGNLDTPTFAGGGSSKTTILTFQHASGWKYGDNFFFIDYSNDSDTNGFNDTDFYTELYVNLSMAKITGTEISFGPISDIGVLLGFNAAGDAAVQKYLPGIRFSWDMPGFAFLNTDFTAYIDDSAGVTAGGAPSEDNSFMFDVNWAYPFSLGNQDFSIEGHGEYISSRDNEFGNKVESWILLQPQFRYDLGKTLFAEKGQLYIGIEWQIWQNKLGDKKTDENVVQSLVVWRL